MPFTIDLQPFTEEVAAEEFEVSVFGCGVGECIVVHLGDAQWAIIDSFRLPESRLPVALEYLRAVGVNPATQVRVLLATHWHWDHVDGFADLIDACPAADVFITGALHLSAMCIYAGRATVLAKPTKSELEFARTIEALLRRSSNRAPRLAQAGLTLHRRNIAGTDVRLTALSPSATTMRDAASQVGDALQVGIPRLSSWPRPSHNRAAVVTHLASSACAALLAADLEVDRDPDRGWGAVVVAAASMTTTRPALLKLSHHGSANGHEPKVWTDLLESEPVGVVTHFHGGASHLPARDDLPQLRQRTCALFSTSRTSRVVGDAFDRTPVGRAQQATTSVKMAKPGLGHVRARQAHLSASGWRVACFNDAEQLF